MGSGGDAILTLSTSVLAHDRPASKKEAFSGTHLHFLARGWSLGWARAVQGKREGGIGGCRGLG